MFLNVPQISIENPTLGLTAKKLYDYSPKHKGITFDVVKGEIVELILIYFLTNL